MTPKTLVVVRHGRYHETGQISVRGKLTVEGRAEMTLLAQVLANRFRGRKVKILSSDVLRAIESAEILMVPLGLIDFTRHSCLFQWYGIRKDDDPIKNDGEADEVVRLIEEADSEVVVLSTHMEYIDQFPTYWGKKKGLIIPKLEGSPKSSARIIDVETGSAVLIYPR